MNVSSTEPRIARTCGCQPSKAREGFGQVASIGPRLAGPGVLLDDRDEVDEAPSADEVVHEVLTRPHPHLGRHLQPQFSQPLLGDQAPVGDTTGEARLVGAEQRSAHGGVDAISADQRVGLDHGAVGEPRLDPVATIGHVDQAVTEMNALGRNGCGQRRQQVGPVHLVVRKPERRLQRLGQRRPQQRPPVVPPALMPRQRFHPGPGQRFGEPQTVQHAGGVRTDLDAGPHLPELRRPLVHLDVEPGAQQRQRRRQTADAAADDRDRGTSSRRIRTHSGVSVTPLLPIGRPARESNRGRAGYLQA